MNPAPKRQSSPLILRFTARDGYDRNSAPKSIAERATTAKIERRPTPGRNVVKTLEKKKKNEKLLNR